MANYAEWEGVLYNPVSGFAVTMNVYISHEIQVNTHNYHIKIKPYFQKVHGMSNNIKLRKNNTQQNCFTFKYMIFSE